MKTIKIIDLLNKIANEENIPEKISVRGNEFVVYSCSNIESHYIDENSRTNWLDCIDIKLTDEVEILDEEDEEDEFEDIEELTSDEYDYTKITINQLIKNQKKIIDRLENIDK